MRQTTSEQLEHNVESVNEAIPKIMINDEANNVAATNMNEDTDEDLQLVKELESDDKEADEDPSEDDLEVTQPIRAEMSHYLILFESEI